MTMVAHVFETDRMPAPSLNDPVTNPFVVGNLGVIKICVRRVGSMFEHVIQRGERFVHDDEVAALDENTLEYG